jgi:hypothetical protein
MRDAKQHHRRPFDETSPEAAFYPCSCPLQFLMDILSARTTIKI